MRITVDLLIFAKSSKKTLKVKIDFFLVEIASRNFKLSSPFLFIRLS